MPIVQERMTLMLDAIKEYQDLIESIQLLTQDCVTLAAFMDLRTIILNARASFATMQIVANEVAHFKAHGARNTREAMRQRRKKYLGQGHGAQSHPKAATDLSDLNSVPPRPLNPGDILAPIATDDLFAGAKIATPPKERE